MHRLNQGLAKGLASHHERPAVILQRPGQNFAGTGGIAIHQHRQRQVREGCAVSPGGLAVSCAIGRADNAAGIEPHACNLNAGVQETARIAAQIQDKRFGLLTFQILDRPLHLFGRMGAELIEADIAYPNARFRLQARSNDRHFNSGAG